jgi:hypothetical protein
MLKRVAAIGAAGFHPAALEPGKMMMATQEQVRPNAADLSNNLFLFADIESSAQSSAIPPSDLIALRAVADWTKAYIITPNNELGRSGPICPFTPVALQHDALWLALEHTTGRSLSEMIERLKGYNQLLLLNAPTQGEIADYKSIVVVFTDLPSAKAKEFFEALLKPISLQFYENDGLVIGPFFEGNEGTAIYNANFRPFTSPVPLLLMRRAVVSDWKFFLNNPEWFKVWTRTHGAEGTNALAAELRRFPWNARDGS